jgi:hypothetical protein
MWMDLGTIKSQSRCYRRPRDGCFIDWAIDTVMIHHLEPDVEALVSATPT